MISISTLTSNADGTVIIDENPNSDLQNAIARVTQVATLDGGSNVAHKGFSHGDRTLFIRADVDEATAAKIWNIFITESIIYTSTPEGFFQSAISRCEIKNAEVSMDIAIKEKLA